jgi:hypothetical protein
VSRSKICYPVVRRNEGRGRLTPGTKCCYCGKRLCRGRLYRVHQCGPGFFYHHVGCALVRADGN